MKITIYSFKTFDDLQILNRKFYYMNDIMYDDVMKYVRHADEAVKVFEQQVSYDCRPKHILCNNSDVVNHILGWCDENLWECEVVYSDEGVVKVSQMVEGCLKDWPYGWYLPN